MSATDTYDHVAGGAARAGLPAIEVTGLERRFGPTLALCGLDLEVRQGEVYGFLGPNGAGKTSTVRVLGTLLAPTSGEAEVAGVPVSAASGPELRRRISVVTENPGLYLKLSVEENLAYFAGLYGVRRGEVAARIGRALAAVGLSDRRRDLAGALSKGLRQRVALARALMNEPQVVFLDEPTQGLDPVAALEVRELIVGLRARGVTVFLTTHRLEEAERLCDRVAILNTTLRSVGSPGELRRRLFASTLQVRVAAPLADPARTFDGLAGVGAWRAADGGYELDVDDPAAAAPGVARALMAAGADIVRLAEAERSLEDVYLQLVNGAPPRPDSKPDRTPGPRPEAAR